MTDRLRPAWRAGPAMMAAALFAATCAGPEEPLSPPRLDVAVSVPPQAYLVERIAGERARVEVMIPPAAAPATYEPSPRQMVALSHARLYVRVGHPSFAFETKHVDPVLRRRPDLTVVDMWTITDPVARPDSEDPHLWLSPAVVERTAREIARVLSELDAGGAESYRIGLQTFLDDLHELDRELRAELGPLAGRGFLVFHPAWGWFAREYGIEQVAIESRGSEPGLAELIRLIANARRDGVRVVFVQRGFSDRGARVIAEEIGARVEFLDPLGSDWLASLRLAGLAIADALGVQQPGRPAGASG